MNGKQLKNSILQWAIQGKLVSQDASEEPAVELLKRIRNEKARLVKEGKIKKDKNESEIFRGENGLYYETIGKVTKCIQDEIPFEVPESWAWCRVRDISKSYIGLTYKPSDVSSDGIIVLRSSNIREGKLILNDIVRVAIEVSSKLYVEKNDILICARNGSKKLVGKSALIEEIREPMTFGAFMAICKTSLYQYVYVYLQSECFFSQLRNVSGTTTINQLTQNNFNNFLVPLPPLAEQKRIVAKIEELMPLVERYTKAQEGLDKLNAGVKGKLRASILQEAIQGKLVPQDANEEPATELLKRINPKFVQPDYDEELPQGWSVTTLSSVASIYTGNSINEQEKKIKYTGLTEGYNYIATKDVGLNHKIDYDNGVKIPFETNFKVAHCGATLLCIEGGSAGRKIGRISQDVCFVNKLCAFEAVGIDSKFLFYYLQSPVFLSIFIDSTSGLIGGVSQKKLRSISIPIPPLAEQKRIVAKIEELFGVLDRL